MRKLLLMAAMLAMMLALVSPAFAHNTHFNAACQNIIGQFNAKANQVGVAAANADADRGDVAVAVAANVQGQILSVMQHNQCLNKLHHKHHHHGHHHHGWFHHKHHQHGHHHHHLWFK